MNLQQLSVLYVSENFLSHDSRICGLICLTHSARMRESTSPSKELLLSRLAFSLLRVPLRWEAVRFYWNLPPSAKYRYLSYPLFSSSRAYRVRQLVYLALTYSFSTFFFLFWAGNSTVIVIMRVMFILRTKSVNNSPDKSSDIRVDSCFEWLNLDWWYGSF